MLPLQMLTSEIWNIIGNFFISTCKGHLCHRLAKLEHYQMIRTSSNSEIFDKKASTIFDKA